MQKGTKHISEFLKLKCASDLLALNVFPNAKEITESMGCFDAIRNHVIGDLKFSDSSVFAFVIGDGNSPRTGALIAMRTAWTVFSIDPKLEEDKYLGKVRRLFIVKKKVENMVSVIYKHPVVIVMPHSHADIKDVLNVVKSSVVRHVVALPCCYPIDISGKTYLGYKDENVWSPKNEFKIWLNV